MGAKLLRRTASRTAMARVASLARQATFDGGVREVRGVRVGRAGATLRRPPSPLAAAAPRWPTFLRMSAACWLALLLDLQCTRSEEVVVTSAWACGGFSVLLAFFCFFPRKTRSLGRLHGIRELTRSAAYSGQMQERQEDVSPRPNAAALAHSGTSGAAGELLLQLPTLGSKAQCRLTSTGVTKAS